MEEVSLFIYLVTTFIVAIACTSVLILMFWISDLISTRRERKKKKSVWDFGEK
jgi:NADH:ubiquinone oxidoreductase subunit 3 (subunit A)